MAAPLPERSPRTEVLDFLFNCLGEGDGVPGASAPPPVPHNPTDNAAPVAAPPAINSPADLRAAHEWLVRERQRLENHTRTQLARIQREQQGLMQQTYQTEQTLIFRAQELSRREELIAHQSNALQQRAAEIADKEMKLAPFLDPKWDAEKELAELRRHSAALWEDIKKQRALLDALRAEEANIRRAREVVEADIKAREDELLQRQQELVKAGTELAKRQGQMRERSQALEREEAAVRRRVAELEEVEAGLRREIEQAEKEIAALRRAHDYHPTTKGGPRLTPAADSSGRPVVGELILSTGRRPAPPERPGQHPLDTTAAPNDDRADSPGHP